MLNPFPTQFLALGAYLFLRLVVGLILIYFGFRHLSYKYDLADKLPAFPWFPYRGLAIYIFAYTEIIAGGMFIAGSYLQYAAIVVVIMSIKMLYWKKHLDHPSIPGVYFYILLIAVSISLFITGAGILAVDLPI
ncbi:DoxX family protein [Candidatus Kaiserbacteria bacterium]|nr:DoxX family protein [Candidatus Kaiserbacteria bacterium]